MRAIERILFPVDFSPNSDGAAHYVKAMADATQAEVTIFHADQFGGLSLYRRRPADPRHGLLLAPANRSAHRARRAPFRASTRSATPRRARAGSTCTGSSRSGLHQRLRARRPRRDPRHRGLRARSPRRRRSRRRRSGEAIDPRVSGVALALLVTTACVRFLLRPDTVSLVLTAAVLALLWRDERRNDRWVFAIVPIQLLWANVHGFQAVGLALVAMALAAELAAPSAPRHPGRPTACGGSRSCSRSGRSRRSPEPERARRGAPAAPPARDDRAVGDPRRLRPHDRRAPLATRRARPAQRARPRGASRRSAAALARGARPRPPRLLALRRARLARVLRRSPCRPCATPRSSRSRRRRSSSPTSAAGSTTRRARRAHSSAPSGAVAIAGLAVAAGPSSRRRRGARPRPARTLGPRARGLLVPGARRRLDRPRASARARSTTAWATAAT